MREADECSRLLALNDTLGLRAIGRTIERRRSNIRAHYERLFPDTSFASQRSHQDQTEFVQ
jgi:hypothetical protein